MRQRLAAWTGGTVAACGTLLAALLTFGGVAWPADEAPITIPRFVEETATAGIDSRYAGDWQYMVGGGVATFDCNADGYPDMLLAGGEAAAKFYLNTGTRGGPLSFKLTPSGLELDKTTGAYPFDIDSDGLTDLVLLRIGENVILRGLGNCRFERANEAFGFDGGDGWSTALAATFERGSGWPTVAIGNYIDRTKELEPWGSCTDNWLYRPAVANSKSQPQFDKPLRLTPSFCPLSMLFTDWNHSGSASLRVSNDREYYEGGQEQMWRVDPGKPPVLFSEAEGWKYLRIWGMGIASADLNYDGYPEYFLSSMADSKLQTLSAVAAQGSPRPSYKDIAFASGVTAHRPYVGSDLRPSTGWHTEFADVNNDGLADLFIAKGNVANMPDFAMADPNNLLIQRPGGKFQEVGNIAGVGSTKVSRGASLVDFNLDGLLDLVVVNRWETAQLWRNVSGDAGHWLEIRLEQPAANREAVGAVIELRRGDKVERREVAVGGGHVSGDSGWLHFGLGSASEAVLRVVWPDAPQSEWLTLPAGGFYSLTPGAPAKPWQP